MQTCLEKVSMEKRHEQIVRSDYSRNEQYSETNLGKNRKGLPGTGHSHWLPNCNGTIGMINYSNFDTSYKSDIGNPDDKTAREKSMVRSLYTAENPYSKKIIDTSANVREGQYVMK